MTDQITGHSRRRVARIALICVGIVAALWLLLRVVVTADDFPAAPRAIAPGRLDDRSGRLALDIPHVRPNVRWS